jgi:hypothetical protein
MGNSPETAAQQQQIQMLQQKIQQLLMERKDKSEANSVKREVATQDNIVKLLLADKEDRHENIKLYAANLASKDQATHSQQMRQLGMPSGAPGGAPGAPGGAPTPVQPGMQAGIPPGMRNPTQAQQLPQPGTSY